MNLKFGVIFAQKGQLTDDEFFSNQETSESFENFLNLLGEKITLKNWDRYRGGLDVHNNMTGTESVYTLFEDHQIMFHVSTLLPFSQEDTQQVRTCSFLPSKPNSFPVFAGFFGPIGKKCNFSSLLLAFSAPWVSITALASSGVKPTIGSKVPPLETLLPEMEKKSSGFFISDGGKEHFKPPCQKWKNDLSSNTYFKLYKIVSSQKVSRRPRPQRQESEKNSLFPYAFQTAAKSSHLLQSLNTGRW